ncbi:MAG: DUF3995 domain-containing protein [Leptospira bouyouniensis]
MTFITIITTLILFSLALVHIYWGFGGLWPGNTKQELIDKVFGKGNQFPSPFSCFFVALGLFLFSMLPILWMFRFSLSLDQQIIIGIQYLMIFVAIIFFMRGILGYLPFITKHWKPIFVYLTKRIYNPLCLFLGTLFLGLVIWS